MEESRFFRHFLQVASLFLAERISLAPRAARYIAISFPMPELAPVIHTTLPSNAVLGRDGVMAVLRLEDSSIAIATCPIA